MKKIKKRSLIKLLKSINRKIELELGSCHPRGGAHLTSKKDALGRTKNTMDKRSIEDES